MIETEYRTGHRISRENRDAQVVLWALLIPRIFVLLVWAYVIGVTVGCRIYRQAIALHPAMHTNVPSKQPPLWNHQPSVRNVAYLSEINCCELPGDRRKYRRPES